MKKRILNTVLAIGFVLTIAIGITATVCSKVDSSTDLARVGIQLGQM